MRCGELRFKGCSQDGMGGHLFVKETCTTTKQSTNLRSSQRGLVPVFGCKTDGAHLMINLTYHGMAWHGMAERVLDTGVLGL